MPAKRHVMHGRDHGVNGADPIPGIGEGGGALDWEDVGVVTPVIPNLQTPHMIYRATSLTGPTGSGSFARNWAPVWVLSAQYIPEGAFTNIYSGDPSNKTLQFTAQGRYLATFFAIVFWQMARTTGFHFWAPSGDVSLFAGSEQTAGGFLPQTSADPATATWIPVADFTFGITIQAAPRYLFMTGGFPTAFNASGISVTSSICIQQLSKG